jgi:MAP7 domain-containing protein 1
MIAKTRITTEEEAKAALAERRRLAREQAEREAELEKLRLVRICSLLLFQNLSSTV